VSKYIDVILNIEELKRLKTKLKLKKEQSEILLDYNNNNIKVNEVF